jgi:xylitol oxidase
VANPARERTGAGNVEYGDQPVQRPQSVDELASVITSSEKVRIVGTRHSFSDIACSTGALVSLDGLARTVTVDAAAGTASVTGSPRYGDLATALHAAGVALPNLGSLPHIGVAGACATGTHGSGLTNRCLAAAVRQVDLLTGEGTLRTLRRGDGEFPGAVVNIGALGAVVGFMLDVEPTYQVRQDVYDDVDVAPEELLDALAEAYSVSLFSDLHSTRFRTGWLKHRTDGSGEPERPEHWRDGTLARSGRHPVPGQPAEGTTHQGDAGPWHERLPHFRLDVPPSSRGDELQSELLVPREHAADAWRAMLALGDRLAPLVQIAELRAVAGDDLWLSMAQGRHSVALHLTWVPDVRAVREALTELEQALEPYGARPHWGKLFVTAPARVRNLYPHLADFAQLAARCDPHGRLRNRFVERYVPGG